MKKIGFAVFSAIFGVTLLSCLVTPATQIAMFQGLAHSVSDLETMRAAGFTESELRAMARAGFPTHDWASPD